MRPSPSQTTVLVEARRRGSRTWRRVAQVKTNTNGVFGLRTTHRDGQRYRAVWTAVDGRRLTGPPIRAY